MIKYAFRSIHNRTEHKEIALVLTSRKMVLEWPRVDRDRWKEHHSWGSALCVERLKLNVYLMGNEWLHIDFVELRIFSALFDVENVAYSLNQVSAFWKR